MGSVPSIFTEIATRCEQGGITEEAAEEVGRELTKLFKVRDDEVAILRLHRGQLHFLYPAILKKVGMIPVNSIGSVAAHVASTKKGEIRNNFAETRHASVFEAAVQAEQERLDKNSGKKAEIIFKLMAAPVLAANELKGIIELCRKGKSPPTAGADFDANDLQKLMTAANQLAKCF